jgi:hypothetical protein
MAEASPMKARCAIMEIGDARRIERTKPGISER